MTTKRGRPAGAKNTPADEQIRKDILRVYKRVIDRRNGATDDRRNGASLKG